MPGVYAYGPFRVQGHAKRWRWWHVVKFGGTEHLHGWAKSCGDAMAAVERSYADHAIARQFQCVSDPRS